MYQHVTIVGNVGQDADFKYTPQGTAVCNFSVAVNKVTGKNETKKEEVTWFKVTCWRERAEVAGQYVKKGMKILVTGEVKAEAYLDKQGQPQAKLNLTASEFKFLSSKEDSAGDRDEDHDNGGYGKRAPVDAEEVDRTPF